jgi:haloalkane dehalogenase
MASDRGEGWLLSREGFADQYPFASHWLDLDGWRYHYLDEGSGPPLLMVHGNPTWSFYWRKLVEAFSPTHRVLAVDHIGCGFSDKPQDYPYRLAQHVANLSTFIDRLDLREITLFAHDWGGAIGLGAAAMHSERFRRFVLFNTAAFRARRIPLRIAACRIPLLGSCAVRGLNLFARAALRMAVEKRERITPAVRAGYLAPYASWAERVALLRFVQDIPLRASHPSYATLVSIEESLAKFRGRPMLLVWGARDWCFTPDFLAEFQRRFPRAQTLLVPDAGHYVLEDAHERIIPRVREFLKSDPVLPTGAALGELGPAGGSA